MLSVPQGRAIVQTVDILAPIVNDPFLFGRIAAANALSDVYALGGEPWCAMNIACFPDPSAADDGILDMLTDILRGGLDALREAGAVLAGGHTVQDDELKYGLSVTGIIDPGHVATNDALVPGQILVLTKRIGTGVLATGVKARWDGAEDAEKSIAETCGRLNKNAAAVIRAFSIDAATDVTGFGLAGHAIEMAVASRVCVALDTGHLPLLPLVEEYAADGLIPAGTHRNHKFALCRTIVEPGVDDLAEILAFDAQTSGGLLLAVDQAKLPRVVEQLKAGGDEAFLVGEVLSAREDGKALILRP